MSTALSVVGFLVVGCRGLGCSSAQFRRSLAAAWRGELRPTAANHSAHGAWNGPGRGLEWAGAPTEQGPLARTP